MLLQTRLARDFVIKPGIVGSPSRLRQFCQQHKIDVVFSSVFETEIGRQAALKLAAELSEHHRAVGFGVNHFLSKRRIIGFKIYGNFRLYQTEK